MKNHFGFIAMTTLLSNNAAPMMMYALKLAIMLPILSFAIDDKDSFDATSVFIKLR